MRWLALALLLVCSSGPCTAHAQLVQFGRTTSFSGGAPAARDVYMCFLGDLQNVASQDDEVDNSPSGAATCRPVQSAGFECQGTYCQHSPFCDTSWQHTGEILLKNLAYELTGQWSRIDYTTISGPDPTQSYWQNPKDHPRCDVIVSLGDMFDLCTTSCTGDPSLADVSPGGSQFIFGADNQYRVTLEFWRIIQASGIPYLILQGNHDPRKLVTQLATDLGYTNNSFVVSTSPSGWAWSIKFPTRTGKQFCVVGMGYVNYEALNADPNVPIDADAVWRNGQIGCGGSLPTIHVSHDAVSPTDGAGHQFVTPNTITNGIEGFSSHCMTSILNTSSGDSVFLVMGGHEVNTVPSSTKQFNAAGTQIVGAIGTTCNPSGPQYHNHADLFEFFSDWQELNRHNGQGDGPYGNTPSDSAGTYYTVVKIDAAAKTLDAWDWTPYWLTQGDYPGTRFDGGLTITTKLHRSWDFDARFP